MNLDQPVDQKSSHALSDFITLHVVGSYSLLHLWRHSDEYTDRVELNRGAWCNTVNKLRKLPSFCTLKLSVPSKISSVMTACYWSMMQICVSKLTKVEPFTSVNEATDHNNFSEMS